MSREKSIITIIPPQGRRNKPINILVSFSEFNKELDEELNK
jgi:hypothetical protein